MRTLAYCAESFREATRKAAGVEPLTCPPLWWREFDARAMEGCDLLYFDLHGDPALASWCGDGGIVALTADQVRAAETELDGEQVRPSMHLVDRGRFDVLDGARLDDGQQALGMTTGSGTNWHTTAVRSGSNNRADLVGNSNGTTRSRLCVSGIATGLGRFRGLAPLQQMLGNA